jgi:GDP-6-deoxy-D-talose 4-dehydrogenase
MVSRSDMTRILLTGADGFTGQHFKVAAGSAGYEVIGLRSDLTDATAVAAEVAAVAPTHVVHLAAISAVTHADEAAFYRVNLFGTLNLLKALTALPEPPQKVLLASSANVYGNQEGAAIAETVCPKPVNHYAMSKLAMEHMAATYADQLPIVITRPFNYTGVGHDLRFVMPKIVDHCVRRAPMMELGNLDVFREYNDVRHVCHVYLKLLAQGVAGEVYNVCSGQAVSLREVLTLMTEITGWQPVVRVNPAIVRANEIHTLAGNPEKLVSCIGPVSGSDLTSLLAWMIGVPAAGKGL